MSVFKACAAWFFLALALSAQAQPCPQFDSRGVVAASEVLSLEGRLIYHDGLRKWYELKLDQPRCGQASIQLTTSEGLGDDAPFEALRGCRVVSLGALDLAPTGYYSRDVFQSVQHIEGKGECRRKPPLPDYSKAKPDKRVSQYRVDMEAHYTTDQPIRFRVTDMSKGVNKNTNQNKGKELRPWQAYASYNLTGAFVLYGNCAEGFAVDKVFGTPQAHPLHFIEPRDPGNRAMFDPESAAAKGKTKLRLGYTCVRVGE
ncbi:MAG: hypothetical protein LBB65_05525 [Burkholderiales bacterium]|nr:hypothetical protein [Burkholderiales bacterium]